MLEMKIRNYEWRKNEDERLRRFEDSMYVCVYVYRQSNSWKKGLK